MALAANFCDLVSLLNIDLLSQLSRVQIVHRVEAAIRRSGSTSPATVHVAQQPLDCLFAPFPLFLTLANLLLLDRSECSSLSRARCVLYRDHRYLTSCLSKTRPSSLVGFAFPPPAAGPLTPEEGGFSFGQLGLLRECICPFFFSASLSV